MQHKFETNLLLEKLESGSYTTEILEDPWDMVLSKTFSISSLQAVT
jgi:hypothetical protein